MSSQVKKEDSNVYSFSTVLLLMYHLHEKIKAISFMSSHNKLSFDLLWFVNVSVFNLGVNCQAIFGVSMSAFTLLQKVSLVGHIIVFCNDKTFLYPILIKSWTQMLFGRNNDNASGRILSKVFLWLDMRMTNFWQFGILWTLQILNFYGTILAKDFMRIICFWKQRWLDISFSKSRLTDLF